LQDATEIFGEIHNDARSQRAAGGAVTCPSGVDRQFHLRRVPHTSRHILAGEKMYENVPYLDIPGDHPPEVFLDSLALDRNRIHKTGIVS
jgi:hypothetical protein